jgi:UDP-GlcNAc:undecaprenyl-phosphate GlcNAc-1-phosphate transferase
VIGPPPNLVFAPLAFASALALTPLLGRVAEGTGYLDHPDLRKHHPHPTPLLGGVAIGLSIVTALLVAKHVFATGVNTPAPGIILGAALSLVLGLIDDWHPMGPKGKLVGQLAAAASLVLWGPRVEWLHGNPIAIAVAILGVVALLNAVNFLDAMDGIVGTILPIIAAGFVALAVLYHAPVATALGWSLVGACAGFLVYNAPPARIFLGDAGSHLLGFGLATLALQALRDEPTLPHLGAIAILLAYPLFDVAFVVWDRTARRKPIYVGGVDHTTHRLSRQFGAWPTLGILALLNVFHVALALWVWGLSRPQAVIPLVLVFGLGYAIFGTYLRRLSPTPKFDI